MKVPASTSCRQRRLFSVVGAVAPVDGVGCSQGGNLVHPPNDGMRRSQTLRLPFDPGAGSGHVLLLAIPMDGPVARQATRGRGRVDRARQIMSRVATIFGNGGIVRSGRAVRKRGRPNARRTSPDGQASGLSCLLGGRRAGGAAPRDPTFLGGDDPPARWASPAHRQRQSIGLGPTPEPAAPGPLGWALRGAGDFAAAGLARARTLRGPSPAAGRRSGAGVFALARGRPRAPARRARRAGRPRREAGASGDGAPTSAGSGWRRSPPRRHPGP